MIKNYQRLLIGIFVIGACVAVIVFFFKRDFGSNTSTEALQESIQTAVLANRDQSARIDRGIYVLDRKSYETGLKNSLIKTKGAGFSDLKESNIMFTYLIDSKGPTLNSKIVGKDGRPKANDYTDPNSDYIAIKGARVLVDANQNGRYTDVEDYVATVIVDTKTGDGTY